MMMMVMMTTTTIVDDEHSKQFSLHAVFAFGRHNSLNNEYYKHQRHFPFSNSSADWQCFQETAKTRVNQRIS